MEGIGERVAGLGNLACVLHGHALAEGLHSAAVTALSDEPAHGLRKDCN